MGRLAKNTEISTRSYAIRMPVGTSIVGPQRPVPGQVRFNDDNNNLELYYSGAWHTLGVSGRVAILKDSFIADGVKSEYSMYYAPTGPDAYLPGQESDIIVFIGGVYQEPLVAYTINGQLITFTSVPNLGLPIVILHNFNSTYVR